MKNLIIFSVLLATALLALLSRSSANADVFSANYYALLALTGVLALSLVGLLGYQLLRLRNKLRLKVFGARLTLRLVIFFSVIGVMPGLLIYAVSVQFLDKSIESWFDVRVEKALEGGLNLGRSGLENSLSELTKKAKFTALLLEEKPQHQIQKALDQLVDEKVARNVALLTAKGALVAYASEQDASIPDLPDAEMVRIARTRGEYGVIDTLPNRGLTLRSIVKVNATDTNNSQFLLQFTLPVPKQVEQDAETVQSVYRDYQELTFSRLSLKRLYAITLTLALLVVVLTSVSAAFFLSEHFGSSLEALADGTRAVAQGDFTGQYPIRSSDELGALTGLFNQMIRQLSDAKSASELQQRQVMRAKGYLESVLTHLSSGVIGLDENLRLRSINTSAEHILGAPLHEMQRQDLDQIAERYTLLHSFCRAIIEAFTESPGEEWQKQIERVSRNGKQILLIRGTRLPPGSGAGYVVVFDDISHLLMAERQAAWGEVARRLAHEIKNPLTPIQLSAERLQHKLSDKLDEGGATLLKNATQTIVSQVAAMKNMVNDFANYARGPAVKLQRLDFHELIREVLGLYEGTTIPIVLELNAERHEINGDATRLRQILHNLLQNAEDALHGSSDPRITLRTESHDAEISLHVTDNGAGFSAGVLTSAFEPYMTTKKKGTGLGLAIVKKIVEEHGGHIAIENTLAGGANVTVVLPLAEEA